MHLHTKERKNVFIALVIWSLFAVSVIPVAVSNQEAQLFGYSSPRGPSKRAIRAATGSVKYTETRETKLFDIKTHKPEAYENRVHRRTNARSALRTTRTYSGARLIKKFDSTKVERTQWDRTTRMDRFFRRMNLSTGSTLTSGTRGTLLGKERREEAEQETWLSRRSKRAKARAGVTGTGTVYTRTRDTLDKSDLQVATGSTWVNRRLQRYYDQIGVDPERTYYRTRTREDFDESITREEWVNKRLLRLRRRLGLSETATGVTTED